MGNPVMVKYLVVAAFAVALLVLSYTTGSVAGARSVQSQWDADKKSRDEVSSNLVLKNTQLSAENARLTQNIEDEAKKNEEQHQKAIAAVHADYAGRLLDATTREGIYRKQAQGSAIERERLASHAAQLDRSLEEGRALVRQLRETVRFREQQLNTLAQQIRADRKLLEEEN